jgi:hypothetical protein
MGNVETADSVSVNVVTVSPRSPSATEALAIETLGASSSTIVAAAVPSAIVAP